MLLPDFGSLLYLFPLELPDLVKQFQHMILNASGVQNSEAIVSQGVDVPEDIKKYKIPGWTIAVHDQMADPALIVNTHGYFLGVKWNRDISVTVKEVR